MLVNNYKASPLSNADIVSIAQQLRTILGFSLTCHVNIVRVLEIALPQLINGFFVEVKGVNEMPINTHAYTDQNNNCIVIREDIYQRAVDGYGRDRLTIAHEIAHLLFHNNKFLVLTRTYVGEKIKTYEDPEWQANAFAGEFLCPVAATMGISVKKLSEKFGVSMDAARNQKRKGGSFNG